MAKIFESYDMLVEHSTLRIEDMLSNLSEGGFEDNPNILTKELDQTKIIMDELGVWENELYNEAGDIYNDVAFMDGDVADIYLDKALAMEIKLEKIGIIKKSYTNIIQGSEIFLKDISYERKKD